MVPGLILYLNVCLRVLKVSPLLTPDHYHIYQRTEFVCSAGYHLVGYQSSECLSNGSWSHPVPKCVPEGIEGKS